jgi:hypothetical protein
MECKRCIDARARLALGSQTLRITHFLGTSENAVRIQIAIALIAFLLLRLAYTANKIVASPLTFTRLIRANLMHRRSILDVLKPSSPSPKPRQTLFDLGAYATRAAHQRHASALVLQWRTRHEAQTVPDSRGTSPAMTTLRFDTIRNLL